MQHGRMSFGNKWYSHEKKFNLDGPDGFGYYWRHLHNDERVFSKRKEGGGSVMVWGGFFYYGSCELAGLRGKENSRKYCDTLQNYLLPFAAATNGETFMFQQDNAAINASCLTKQWLNANNLSLLPWIVRSPDLNPIEKLWAILAQNLYRNGK